VADLSQSASFDHVPGILTFFDRQYAMHERYWWRGENRYSIEPTAHTPYNARLLTVAARRGHGRALDLGAGEGADAIRLAKLGYHVDAVEMSAVACEKIEHFARAQGVRVHVRNELLESVNLTGTSYDLVIMNGCLHYVRDKNYVLKRVLAASTENAVHAVALFSTATPVPAEHSVVPVFPDEEGGVVERFYHDWDTLLLAHERGRSEHSHPGFAPHVHSYIKLIAARGARMVNGR
jgi:SAM-dependent methyltransferase